MNEYKKPESCVSCSQSPQQQSKGGNAMFFQPKRSLNTSSNSHHQGEQKLAPFIQQKTSPDSLQRIITEHSEKEYSTHADAYRQQKRIPNKNICFTFDDGPIKTATEEVLSAISPQHATFFLTGSNLASDPAEQYRLVKEILKHNHQIANHSFTHDPMTKKQYRAAGEKAVVQDFQKNKKHFEGLFSSKNDTFKGFSFTRLPGDGRTFPSIVSALTADTKVPHISWGFEFAPNGKFGHVKNKDWQGIAGVSATSKDLPPANTVILLHDAHWKGKQAILKQLVDFLVKNSFSFGSLNPSGKCV